MALKRVVAQELRVLGEERRQRIDESEGKWGQGGRKGEREGGVKDIFCIWMGVLRDSFRVHRPS